MATRTISSTGTKAITDGVTTNAANTLTSVLGLFDASMVGDVVTGSNIPGGTTISGFVNANAVTMSQNASGASTGITVTARSWASSVMWVEGAVPTAADDVVSTTTSVNLRVSATANCRSLDFDPAGGRYAATFTHDAGITINVGTSSGAASGVAVRFSPTMTYTKGVSSTFTMKHTVTNGGNGWTITSAGLTMCDTWIVGGAAGGSWVLADTWTMDNANVFYNQFGTFSTGGFNMTIGAFNSSFANTRVVNLNGSTITMSNSGTPWNCTTTTGLTLNASTSTLVFAGSGGNFQTGGLAYANVTLNISSNGTFTMLTGGCSFATFSGVCGALVMPASGTVTATTWNVRGKLNVQCAVRSSSAGTAVTVVQTAGRASFDYCSLKDLTCQGGAAFRARHSSIVSGVTGVGLDRPMAMMGVG